jgi:hypothetical protein
LALTALVTDIPANAANIAGVVVAAGVPNTVRLALPDWKTGFQPVMADSASCLSSC